MKNMNNKNINELVGRFLAANPDAAKRLVQAAAQYEAEQSRKREIEECRDECAAMVKQLDATLAAANKEINMLKGVILDMYKTRKIMVSSCLEADELLKDLS